MRIVMADHNIIIGLVLLHCGAALLLATEAIQSKQLVCMNNGLILQSSQQQRREEGNNLPARFQGAGAAHCTMESGQN